MKTTTIFKSLSVLAIGLMFTLNANAQERVLTSLATETNPQKSTTLSVQVGEFYSLTLSKDNATILLDSEEKFHQGSKSEEIEMNVFSSRKYAIDAVVSSEVFTGVAENTSVNTNNIDLLVTATGDLSQNVTDRAALNLKTTADRIVVSPKATKSDTYKLVYEIPAANTSAFLDQYGKTITTQITYTLMPL